MKDDDAYEKALRESGLSEKEFLADQERKNAGMPEFVKPDASRLEHRFKHHPPSTGQTAIYAEVRQAILKCALRCVDLTPCSPEQTRALNALDEAMFLFNAAIARNE